MRLANDTEYDLACGIFTTNLGTAMRMAKRVRTGIQYVNPYRLGAAMGRIGGFGERDRSREAGRDAINEFTKPTIVWINENV